MSCVCGPWTCRMRSHIFPSQITFPKSNKCFPLLKKALQGQELHNNVAGSALLGLAKMKKQPPSRFISSLGLGAAWFAGCSKLLCGRMLRAPSLQDALCSYHSNAGCFKLLLCRLPRGSSCVQVAKSCLQPFLLLMLHLSRLFGFGFR